MPPSAFATTFRVSQFEGARLLSACSRARRLLSSTASKALCFAPIGATRQCSKLLRDSTSKFPFVDTFKLSSGELYRSAEVIAGLAPLATSKRLATLDKVVNGRSFSILPIVEGLHDMGNLGAVCRSADALGLGAVHCINAESQRYRARKQRNSAGAEKWMDIRMWDSSASCIQTAKAAGYHVVATHFDPDAVSIHDVDWTQPTAVILGNEREGVSAEAIKLADSTAYIPMSGFVSSFNVSVAAALVFYEARRARLECLGHHCDLSEHEKQILTAVMLLRHQGRTTQHIEELLERSQEGSLTAASRVHRDAGGFVSSAQGCTIATFVWCVTVGPIDCCYHEAASQGHTIRHARCDNVGDNVSMLSTL